MPKFALSDLSMGDRTQLLSRALDVHMGSGCWCYIRDVYDDFLVYYDYDKEAAYKVTYSIADDYAVTFGAPSEVIERTVYEPVSMGAFALSNAFVSSNKVNLYPESLLFEINGPSQHFPGQGVTITEKDLADIASLFTTASMGLQHVDTVLGDNCGSVQDVWLDETGRRLYGTVAVPKGLDELIPPGPRKVSVEIFENADGKKYIPKVDLVLEPQIERAALMSCMAFAKGEPTPKPAIPATQPNNSARPAQKGKEKATMSGWDRVKTALEGVGFKFSDEAAADPAAVELQRKAAEFDKLVGRTREQAKADAVIAFGKDKGAAEAAIIDALPAGQALDVYAQRMADAAAAFTRNGNGQTPQRQTAANTFGAVDADQGRQPAGEFKSSGPVDANQIYNNFNKASGRG